LFTAIIHTYFRPQLLRKSLDALLNQTYDNLEVIAIDDGATEETKDCLTEYQNKDSRLKIINFKENQFRENDPHRIIEVCFNAALEMAKGKYIWHQDDDDIISLDYLEKMQKLFKNNNDCISAAGLPISMDINDKINQNEIINRKSNYRPKYMPGHILALQSLKKNQISFSAPGQIFSFRKDALIKYGKFHKSYEPHHLYGIVPFGITGFDESAHFYWRRHSGQINISLSSKGWIGTRELFSMIDDLNIENKWKAFGNNTAKYVVRSIKRQQAYVAAYWFSINLVTLNLTASIKILLDIWRQATFWIRVPFEIYKNFIKIFHPKNIYKKLFGK